MLNDEYFDEEEDTFDEDYAHFNDQLLTLQAAEITQEYKFN